MGTEIQLRIGSVSLSYAKNFMGEDFGFLFQAGDETRVRSDGINYEYYEEHPDEEDLATSEAAFVSPLSRVLRRIKLLGHTLDVARAEYQALLQEWKEDSDDNNEPPSALLTFEEFCRLACLFPISSLSSEYIEYDTPERAKVAQGRFADYVEKFERVPPNDNSDMYWSESSYLSAKLCILSATSMLQIFGTSRENADAEVNWQFGLIVSAGWVSRENFQPGTTRAQTILVATEGASDARVLRRALDLLRPDVTDFFRFIDGEERHHFWGTGNLVKFAEGLVRIDVQNQVLFLLDNDAEGVEAYQKFQQLNLPVNMRAMLLPNLDELKSFPCRGPEGVSNCDINGRAAAIECYLDLNLEQYPPARVTWTNYKKDMDAWHGALEHKDSYMRHFLDQDVDSLKTGTYDSSKIFKLLDVLIHEASILSGQNFNETPAGPDQ
ncbi:MAG: HEPN/Toprim-associated domain-containing protein [Lysobacteraceae bacterium]